MSGSSLSGPAVGTAFTPAHPGGHLRATGLTQTPRCPQRPQSCWAELDFSSGNERRAHQREQEDLMTIHEPHSAAEAVTEAVTAIEVLARALHIEDARLQPTLDVLVANAAAASPHAPDAGIILYTGGKLVPQATTGQAPQVLDLKQQENGGGPCIQAARKTAPGQGTRH